ncbi:MAG: radical SAM protein [Nanoarchaeota archaeon]|nr:radical SAM protein [Nanoarchaeota archaeon]
MLNLLHVGKDRILDKLAQAKIAAGIMDRKVYNGPWEVQIDLTNTCNNDCIGCWCHSPLLGELAMSPEQKKKRLTFDTARQLIDDLHAMGTRYIYFTGGGEPFMHPNALEVIEYVKHKGMITDMSTNFTLINEEKARRLVKAGMDHMNISLWAGSGYSYAATHPNKEEKDFDRLIAMLRYLADQKRKLGRNRPQVHIYNVISTKNYMDFENMIEIAYIARVNGIDFTPTDVVPGKTDSLMLSREQADELRQKVEAVPSLMQKMEKKYHHKIDFRGRQHFIRRLSNLGVSHGEYDSNIIGTMPCYAGYTFLRILADGNVNSCLKSVRIPVGNINEKSIRDIWHGAKQEEFRKHTIDYDPKNPYFENIGNEHQKGNGCYLCCDNLGINMAVHGSMKNMGMLKKTAANIAKRL